MSQLIDDITMNYDKYVIMGDVTFDMLSSNCDENSVSNICNLFDLKKVITLPTCFKTPRVTLLDIILTPNIQCLQTHGVIDTGLSDYHRMIYMVTKVHTSKPQKRQVTYRSLKTLNVEQYIYDLEMAPFQVGEIFEDVDDQYYFVNTLFTEISNEHIPLTTRNIKPKQPLFMNAALHKATMNKARLQQKTQKNSNCTNWENIRQQRNPVTKIKRKSIMTYFHERCPDNGSSHPKTFGDTVHPFFSDKRVKSSDNIQLLQVYLFHMATIGICI